MTEAELRLPYNKVTSLRGSFDNTDFIIDSIGVIPLPAHMHKYRFLFSPDKGV